jgi:hypothetical protein
MKFERAWKNGGNKSPDPWREIDRDRVNRDLANKFGENAAGKLEKDGELETQYGLYRAVE